MQQKLFSHALKKHFLKTTVVRSFKLTETELLQLKTNTTASINPKEPYQQFNYNEEEPNVSDLAEKQLAPVFQQFCDDGDKWISTASEVDKQRLTNIFEDYMTMRRAIREETHILTLNKVGIERDQKKMRDNVARHVGLSMPKLFTDVAEDSQKQ